MLSSENRLKKRKEFGFIYKNGKIIYSKNLNVIYVNTNRKVFRIGFSISKKVGKAVIRNRIKRRLSEIIRNNLNLIKNEYNYVIIVKPGIDQLNFFQLKDELLNILKKGNLLVWVFGINYGILYHSQ